MDSSTALCLSDDVLVDLLDGRLSDEALRRLHQHASGCPACRRLLASVSRGGMGPSQVALGSTPTPDAPPDTRFEVPDVWTPPDTFGEFRLERVLGRGGMGVVYLAHDTSLGRRVAVKFIASEQPEPWLRAYFDAEARAIARLQHPNVVSVFRVGEIDGHPYIVSEYVVGQSLAELPLPVPWRRVLTLGIGLARGLAAAHRQGVLHRDLKPSNALVTGDGQVKLLDFGLAERFEPGADGTPAAPSFLVGTRPYLAPELLARAPATPRSDLYALGLVLRELCTGELPRSAPRPRETEGARADALPEVDPDFAAVIARCLAPEPLERFASADALCAALERLDVPAVLGVGNPYRGLEPFEAGHQALFFGRDDDIRAVLERLRHRPLVLVAGESGAGKSSLCRAGVLPRVDAELLGGTHTPLRLTLWPGRRPLEALAAALAPVLRREEAELAAALAHTPGWLGRALREAHQDGRGLVLFIDQLEELLTLAEPTEAAHFTRLLGELALPARGVRVLLAVRGDFLTRLCALPGLGEEAERALYILRPMTPSGVREAIIGPARARGVIFESGALIQTLVDSTASGLGGLSPLQFALAALWERRDVARGLISEASLEGLGGVAGVLSRHADAVLARLGAREHEAARRLLLRLVTEEGTRLTRAEPELLEPADEPSRIALRALVEGRLLHTRTTGGHPGYALVHDSLLKHWGTLRGWLDADIGQRAASRRIEVASAEWEQLSRARDALWGPRQLDEVRGVVPASLGARERTFLRASHRAVLLRRWGTGLAALGLGLAITLAHGASRWQSHLDTVRFIEEQTRAARGALDAGRALTRQAVQLREGALGFFDSEAPGDRERAEQRWAEALALHDRAEAAFVQADLHLEKSLDRDREHADTRELLAETTSERVLLAEHFHRRREREEAAERLARLAETSSQARAWLERLSAPAELSVRTEPAGAHVELERFSEAERAWRPATFSERLPPDLTPLLDVHLREGSYRLRLTHPERAPVLFPVWLGHGAHEQVSLVLPRELPAGQVYIPPGCFLEGSAEPEEVRGFMLSPPLHTVCVREGFLIGRNEVTFGDWLTYLEALPPDAPARRLLEQPRFGPTGAVSLRREAGGWVFALHRLPDHIFSAREGEPLRYPERSWRSSADWRHLPLAGVSAEDLTDYFAWLDRTRRLPGARLCTQHEWEYAARGADGRRYPHGNTLRPDDANIDTTYGRKPLNYGPDTVGAHPDSESPFGLEDAAGNAFELTRATTPEFGRIVLRGGSWYYDSFGAYVANISVGDPTAREANIGVRVCAPPPPP